MGTLTVTDMENEVKENLGGRADLDSRLHRFLNFSQEQLVRYHAFDELETVVETNFVSGNGALALPDKPLNIRSFRLIDGSNSRKLVYHTPRQFDRLLPKADWYSTGRPSIYTAYGQRIEVWRVPDDTYTCKLRYKKYPTTLTDGSTTQTSDLEGMDDILIALATSWAFRSLGESEKASYWIGIAAKAMRLAKDSDMYKVDYEPTGEGSVDLPAGDYWKNPFIKGVR